MPRQPQALDMDQKEAQPPLGITALKDGTSRARERPALDLIRRDKNVDYIKMILLSRCTGADTPRVLRILHRSTYQVHAIIILRGLVACFWERPQVASRKSRRECGEYMDDVIRAASIATSILG